MKDGVSVYISALSPENARELFEYAMTLIATGEYYNGEIITGVNGGGAQIYTHL